MKNTNGLRVITMSIGILSLMAMVFSHLALVDIFHGEENVSLEWLIVQVSAGILLLYICLSLFSLWKSRRTG
jgi:hypothetical protein